MSVKATINGEVWEFSTVAEAAEFKRSMAPAESPNTPTPPTPARGKRRGRATKAARRSQETKPTAAVPSNGAGLSDDSRRILEAARKTPAGLRSEDFAREIGVSVRAVPVRMMNLNKELKALGIPRNDVIQRGHVYVKGRKRSVYKAGARLDDAMRHNGELFTAR